jgi:formamidopyrimidine-DNA glycosylase
VPELPEVEVVRRGLERWVAGREVSDVEVLHPRAIRRHEAGAPDLISRITQRSLGPAARRGKFLWIPLLARDGAPTGESIVAHLGMSGQLLVQEGQTPDEKHLRVRLRFADGGRELRFVDQRTFGGVAVEALVDADDAVVPESVAHIARDPLDPAFDLDRTVRALRRRHQGIKRALLDQTLISGVGNIYADEALWRSRLHNAAPTDSLTRARVVELIGHATDVMVAALDQGGTSFDALYVNVNGESGYFDRSLDAYGRNGIGCRRCGTAMIREPWANRSSYRCPRCQRRPRSPLP